MTNNYLVLRNSAQLIGQASKQQFENNIDHAVIGAGLVQAPLQ